MITVYRQTLIEDLIAKESGRCRYCSVEVRKNWCEYVKHDDDATVDHIIPKSKGGANTMENYALACRRCNHAKGDRSVEEFLADPRSAKERRLAESRRLFRRRRRTPVAPATPAEMKPKMTASQTAAFLRESAALAEAEKAKADPLVQSVLARFPGAEVVAVRKPRRQPSPIQPIDFSKLYERPVGVPVEFPNDATAQAAFEAVYRNRTYLLRT